MDSPPLRHGLALLLLLASAWVSAEDEPVLPSLPQGDAGVASLSTPSGVEASATDALSQGVCRGYAIEDPRWFDRAQIYFSERACRPAVWFDRFFGGERAEDEVASSLVRVLSSLQYSEKDFTDAGILLRARVNLPNLRRRLNIVVNDDADERDGLLPGDTQRPRDANAPGQDSSAALRYLIRMVDRSGADFDIGLRNELKFFARARYYRTWEHSPVLESRVTQTVYFRDGEGFGEVTLYEVERMLAEDMLVRWSSQARLSENFEGLDLREGIHLLRQIDRRRAISWGVGMTVNSEPAWQAVAYSTSVRYRQRIFRPWLFLEIEPFIDAARGDRFNPNPGIAFRLEMLVGDAGDRQFLPANTATPSPAQAGEDPVQAVEGVREEDVAPAALPAGADEEGPLALPETTETEAETEAETAIPAPETDALTSPDDVPPTDGQ